MVSIRDAGQELQGHDQIRLLFHREKMYISTASRSSYQPSPELFQYRYKIIVWVYT